LRPPGPKPGAITGLRYAPNRFSAGCKYTGIYLIFEKQKRKLVLFFIGLLSFRDPSGWARYEKMKIRYCSFSFLLLQCQQAKLLSENKGLLASLMSH